MLRRLEGRRTRENVSRGFVEVPETAGGSENKNASRGFRNDPEKAGKEGAGGLLLEVLGRFQKWP